MAFDLIFLDQARDDLRELSDFLFPLNPQAASRYVGGLEEACQKLRMFPLAGRMYNDTYRLLVFRNHLIFYRVSIDEQKVHVVTIVDGRRDPARYFDRRAT